MKKHWLRSISFLLVLGGITMSACSKDDDSGNSNAEELDGLIRSMSDPEQESAQPEEQIGDVLSEIDEETDTYCECTKYKASAEFNENMLLDPTSNVIYPGSILEGNSVVDGSYRQIVLDRAPLKISTNLQNFSGEASRVVEEPSLSNVRSEIKQMIYDSEVTGATQGEMTFSIQEIYSEDQLSLAIGTNVKAFGQKVKGGFGFGSKTIQSRFLVKFVQVYYTVDVDAPSSPSRFFADNVTAEDLRKAIGGGNTVPVYVSSVKYGRAAYFAMVSNERADSVKAQLEAEIKAGMADVDVATQFGQSSYTKNLSITGTIIGGSGEDGTKSVDGQKGLIEYIQKGGNYSKESPGAPIAYTLTRLSNNEVFNLVNGTEYVVRKCKSMKGSVMPKYIYGISGDNTVYGQVTAQLGYEGETTSNQPTFYIFNKKRGNAISVPIGQKPDIDCDEEGVFKLDYGKIDKAYIEISFDLHDSDAAEDCTCADIRNNASNDELYPRYKIRIYLNDMSVKEVNGKDVEIALNDDIFECVLGYTTDIQHHHKSCGFLGTNTCHETEYRNYPSKIKFAFKINM